jgi:hypothetical protein
VMLIDNVRMEFHATGNSTQWFLLRTSCYTVQANYSSINIMGILVK